MSRRPGALRQTRWGLAGVLLALATVVGLPALAQETTPGTPPATPGTPPATPEPPATPPPTPPGQLPPPATPTPLTPVPVIPPAQPFPPSTVSSAPQPTLPVPGLLPVGTFTLQPSITLSEEYTDNFDLEENNKRHNFRTSLSPNLTLLINTPLTKGILGYTFSPSYDTATNDFRFFHSLLGRVSWDATPRWRLTVADTFTRDDAPDNADSLGLRQNRRAFTTNTFSLLSEYLIGTVTTSQSYRLTIFDSNDGNETMTHNVVATASMPFGQTNTLSLGYDYLNSSSAGTSSITTGSLVSTADTDVSGHQLTLAVSRQINTLWSAGIRGSYGYRSASDDTGDDVNYGIWNVALFSTYTVPGRFILSGSAGISGIKTDDGESAGPNFFTATSLTYQFAQAVATLAVSNGFSETFSSGQNFGITETLTTSASLSYPFTPLVSSTLRGFFTRNETVGSLVGTRGETDENWGGTLALTYRIRSNIVFDLAYTYRRHKGSNSSQGSNVDDKYSENRVRAALSLSF